MTNRDDNDTDATLYFPESLRPAQNAAASTGRNMGVASLMLSFVPIFGIVAWVIAPIGVLQSGKGLTDAELTGVGGAQARAGLVSSVTSLIVCSAWVGLFSS